MDAETFLFRKCLYQVSHHLSHSEVDKLKFMLDDDLPRAQLEAARTGFDLFCLMEEKNYLSSDNLEFLRDILDTVGKDHFIDRYLTARAMGGDQLKPIPGFTGSLAADSPVGEEKRTSPYKKFLGQLGDAMSNDNIRDMSLFFHGEKSSIKLQDVEKVRSAEQVFTKLRNNHVILPGNLTVLYNVLDVLGRQDLCEMISHYYRDQEKQQTLKKDSAAVKYAVPVYDAESVQYPHPPSSEWSSLSSGSLLYSRSDNSSLNPPANPSIPDTDGLARGQMVYPGMSGRQLLPPVSLPPSDSDKIGQLEEEKRLLQDQLLLAKKQSQFGEVNHENIQKLQMCLRDKTEEVEQLRSTNQKLKQLAANRLPAYDMRKNPHGVAVVIVNELFDKNPHEHALELKNRKGAPKDLRLFVETFRTLNYIVEYHSNLGSEEMLRVIDEVGQRDHSNYDSFVCCVSTHGSLQGFYGSDSVLVRREEFEGLVKKTATLVGKPKIFFVQSCRKVMSVTSDCPGAQIPPHQDSDMFVVNAATPNNEAYISAEYGSWLASSMHKVFTDDQYRHDHSLASMMNIVSDMVNRHVGLLDEGGLVQQCVQKVDTLTKDVLFFQGTN